MDDLSKTVIDTGTKHGLPNDVQNSLVNSRNRFCALQTISETEGFSECLRNGLRMCLVCRRDKQVMSLPGVVFSSKCCNNTVFLVLPDSHFLDTLRTMMAFAEMFVLDYETPFYEAT